MKVNLTEHVKDFNGEPIQMNGHSLTVGMACAIALNNNTGEPECAVERGLLAMRLYHAGEIEISPEEAAMVRKELGKALSPVVAAQVHVALS